MDSTVSENIPTVLITGFGPFRSILINPSWQVAKALKNDLEWKHPVHVIIEEIPVKYDEVSNQIPHYWLTYNPTLVVHIGVAAGTTSIQIEECAHNNDYCHLDTKNCTPENGCCIQNDAPNMLKTLLPIDDVCQRVQTCANVPVTVSNDAGRYLCEFIYYQSLFIDAKRTVFIHIPEIDECFTLENLAKAIQLVIYELLYYVNPLPRLNEQGNYLINPNAKVNADED